MVAVGKGVTRTPGGVLPASLGGLVVIRPPVVVAAARADTPTPPSLTGPGVITYPMTIDVTDASSFLVQGSLQPGGSCQFPNDAVVPTTGLNWNVAQEVAVQPVTCQAIFVRGWSVSDRPPVADFGADTAALAPLTSTSGSSRHDTDLTMCVTRMAFPRGHAAISQLRPPNRLGLAVPAHGV